MLTLALTDETYHMINKETLAQMKPGAFLVNMARGGIVCTEDLVDALNRGHLSGAGLDVTEEQPLGQTASVGYGYRVSDTTLHAAGSEPSGTQH